MSGYHYEYCNGRSTFVRNGETIVKNYFSSSQDGHGGRAAQHHAEMRQEAIKVIQEIVPPMIETMCVKICTDAVENIISAIEWDIHEIVDVSFDDISKVFHSEKFRKVISDKIMESIKKNLKNIEIK